MSDEFAEYPEQLARSIDDCRLKFVAGGGAFLFYEQPAECARVLKQFIVEL